MLTAWIAAALGADLIGATDLYAHGDYACARMEDGEDLCWMSARTPAVARSTVPDKRSRRWQRCDTCADRDTEGRVTVNTYVPPLILDIPPLSEGPLLVARPRGCALAPDGRVACWGDNDSAGVGSHADLPLYWVKRRWDVQRSVPTCGLDDGDVRCPLNDRWWSKSMPPVVVSGVERLVGTGTLHCAQTATDVRCFGYLPNGHLIDPERTRIEAIDVAVSGDRAAALDATGQVYALRGFAWEPVFELQGAEEVYVTAALLCARAATTLVCERKGVQTRVGVDGPIEPGSGMLCFGERCLKTTPGELRHTVYWVQR